jgi:phosphocarrier protein
MEALAMSMENKFEKTEVLVRNESGLHARPAAVLAQEAQKYSSEIRLSAEGKTADAKSILDILSLAAQQGTGMIVEAEGDDADTAVDRLRDLFHNRFGEEK